MTREPEDRHRLLVGVTGSGNVLNLPHYLAALAADSEVRVVMTRSAASILPPAAVRLVCPRVHCDGVDELAVSHVELASWADTFVVLPATANILGQAANGLASGLLSTALLARRPPVLFFPSMNPVMWEQRAVRRNVERLRGDGHLVIDPVPGDAWIIANRRTEPVVGAPGPAAVAEVVRELRSLEGEMIGGRP
ncbi:flavoprotein [Kitasatospora sp. NPDC057198]|uniref:flavoprotein n=1 Tax=Kitasatospora sp. NPDC057198 TaxID=3346046 RepID=UPI0036276853